MSNSCFEFKFVGKVDLVSVSSKVSPALRLPNVIFSAVAIPISNKTTRINGFGDMFVYLLVFTGSDDF